MPSNWSLFKSMMRFYIPSFTAVDRRDAAKKMANAYNASVMGQASTIYGNTLLSGSVSLLEKCLFVGMEMNFRRKNPDDGDRRPFRIMASGFSLYWVGASLTPVPPHPPTIAPIGGVIVSFPGEVESLSRGLELSFTSFDLEKGLNALVLALEIHLKTVSGLYSGAIPTPTGPIPSAPLPWIGIF